MFGKKAYLKTLERRKEELLAQCEVNRVELANDWDSLLLEVQRVKKNLKAAGSIASCAAVLATVTALLRRRPPPGPEPKTDNHTKFPWMSAALNGARVGATLFFKARSFLRERR